MRVNWVVALLPEARGLIDHFGLRRDVTQASPFELYRNDQMRLVISGMGKLNAAAATGWLAATAPSPSVWLNVGICGHGSEPVGSLLQAVKIVDIGTGKVWYPPQIVRHSMPLTSVHTIEHIEKQYADSVAYEMEASGFYCAASRVSTGELCQCLKVVSDNVHSPVSQINPNGITDLVTQHSKSIASVAEQLIGLGQELSDRPRESKDLHRWLDKWHFSVTQTHELTRLLRLLDLRTTADPLWRSCEALPRSRDVLSFLRERLSQLPGIPDPSQTWRSTHATLDPSQDEPQA